MQIDIVQTASVITALSVILGVVVGGYKLVDSTKRQNAENKAEIKRIKSELTLICYAMQGCLDGLEQLGANHTVTEAKTLLDKHLNKQAHGEE